MRKPEIGRVTVCIKATDGYCENDDRCAEGASSNDRS